MNKRNTFIIAVAIPLLILLAMTVKPAASVLLGQEILLKTVAVDPNDLFRGEYVALDFKISTIRKSMLPDSVKQYTGKQMKDIPLFVSLKPEGKFYVVDTVSEKKPDLGIYLKAKLRYYDYNDMADSVHLDYSLDKYFVKQGSGKELQEQSNKGELVGKVKVLNGYGILTGVEPSSN